LNPQHIVYLALILLAIGIILCAIDPMSPNSIRIIEDYCGMNDRIGECLLAILTKPEIESQWHHYIITYDGNYTDGNYIDTGLTISTEYEYRVELLDVWSLQVWYAEYRGIA